MSEKSDFQIKKKLDFQAQHQNFHLPLEPKNLKLEGTSIGNRPPIYVWLDLMKPLKKSP